MPKRKRRESSKNAPDGIKQVLRKSNDEISVLVGNATSTQAGYRMNWKFLIERRKKRGKK
jgi:hypothetical protein